MSDGKTTVKDLASMLGANAKDILRVLRDLNIAARSTSSTISDDDLPRVKARLNMEQAEQEGRREVHPGVIVRRRRAVEEPVAAEGPVSADSTTTFPLNALIGVAEEPEPLNMLSGNIFA